MPEPFFAIGNDELGDQSLVKRGELIRCSSCLRSHPLEYGTSNRNGKQVESDRVGFIACKPGCVYLVALDGRLLPGHTIAKRRPAGVVERDTTDTILRAMSEREFQSSVRKYLEKLGWTVYVIPDMRKTAPGWPDLVCLHPAVPVMLAFELKKEGGRPKPKQRDVLGMLGKIPGIDTRIVRPSTWEAIRDEIDEMMRRAR